MTHSIEAGQGVIILYCRHLVVDKKASQVYTIVKCNHGQPHYMGYSTEAGQDVLQILPEWPASLYGM
jgi:hypothetical protein